MGTPRRSATPSGKPKRTATPAPRTASDGVLTQHKSVNIKVPVGPDGPSAAQQKIRKTKQIDGPRDFLWSERPEPHKKRTAELLAKYGKEIRALTGPCPWLKYQCLLNVAVVLGIAAWGHQQAEWWKYWGAAWVCGIFIHSAFLAIHEVTHHVAFKSQVLNDALACIVNWPIVIPYAQMFKKYHAEHHHYQGWDGVDTDIPSELEVFLFRSVPGKFFFVTTQILFYALRPCLVRAPKPTVGVLFNYLSQAAFDYVWWRLFGFQGLLFLLISVLLAGSWNPVSGHFISEHYVFDPEGRQETHSYYGFWNIISYNVGYHNEHHDFPMIPGSRLPALKKLAPEFYDAPGLRTTASWIGAAWDFVWDPNVALWCRVKREKGAGQRTGPLLVEKSKADAQYPEVTMP